MPSNLIIVFWPLGLFPYFYDGGGGADMDVHDMLQSTRGQAPT